MINANKKYEKAVFKEGPGKYKCSKCGDSRNKTYPMYLKQYCTKCYKKVFK